MQTMKMRQTSENQLWTMTQLHLIWAYLYSLLQLPPWKKRLFLFQTMELEKLLRVNNTLDSFSVSENKHAHAKRPFASVWKERGASWLSQTSGRKIMDNESGYALIDVQRRTVRFWGNWNSSDS